MIDFKNGKEFDYPFPHMIVEDCFDENTLENLINEFPDVEEETVIFGGRKQMNVLKNHANPNGKLIKNEIFKDWIKTVPTWNKFYNWLNSDVLFHEIISKYEEQLKKWDSVVDNNNSLNTDCFVHIDWSSAGDGYQREIHRDSDKRIWNFLIFLNDKDWKGGDTLIHSSDNLIEYPRHLWDNSLPIYKKIEAKKNRGLFFLSTPNSYHSVNEQFYTKTDRKFIYGSYSIRKGDTFMKRVKFNEL